MANRRNIGNISRIGRRSLTQRLRPRGGFETTSKNIEKNGDRGNRIFSLMAFKYGSLPANMPQRGNFLLTFNI